MWLVLLVIISSLFLNKTGALLGVCGELSWNCIYYFGSSFMALQNEASSAERSALVSNLGWFHGSQPLEFLFRMFRKGWVFLDSLVIVVVCLLCCLLVSKVFCLVFKEVLRSSGVSFWSERPLCQALYSCLEILHFWYPDSFCSSSHLPFISCINWTPFFQPYQGHGHLLWWSICF